MSYLLTLVALTAAGLAILALLRLRTGHLVPDVALGWLVGSGWLGAAASALRFAGHVPFGRGALAVLVLAPIAAWGALWARGRREAAAPADAPAAGEGGAEGRATSAPPRWRPRPLWLFAAMAVYVVVVAGAVVLHGGNTPTHTDDGVRVRAFAPMLAFDDAWGDEARLIFAQAGPIATFAPAVAWIATGSIDHFHVNYAVLTELLALLALVVGLGAARGDPERGWAGAFALLSLPLFVYHCTSTYSDAVLAMRAAGGVLLAAEYARTRQREDLFRAALLLGLAALVKREGELVAAAPALVLAAQVAWERWREQRPVPWRAAALLLGPGILAAAGKIAALGVAGAFPMLGFVFFQAAEAAAGPGALRPPGIEIAAARVFVEGDLFRSGNQGMLYWILAAVLVVRARELRRRELLWPLLAAAALLGEVAVSSIVLIPRFTIDQSTANRALLVASLPAALWVAAALVDAARAGAVAGATGAAVAEATPPGRRRSRRASRR
jgi:hypothetical protein